jgi:hypothetical protein
MFLGGPYPSASVVAVAAAAIPRAPQHLRRLTDELAGAYSADGRVHITISRWHHLLKQLHLDWGEKK